MFLVHMIYKIFRTHSLSHFKLKPLHNFFLSATETKGENMASTIKALSTISSIKKTPLFNEQEWVIEVQRSIKEDIADEDVTARVSIFCVPQALVLCKPEAYVPQLLALGPYHHWRPQLYDMERYKIAAARRIQGRINGVVEFDGVVKKFVKKEYKTRCHYHKHLDVNGDTLAWMMAIDGSFLLEFLQSIYFKNQDKAQREAQPTTLSKRIEHERAKVGFNMIIRDITMLENQIPLFLLRKLFKLVCSQKDIADEELSNILTEFVREVSPFKITDDSLIPVMDNITRHAHLLELLYWTVVPKAKVHASEINKVSEQNGTDVESKEEIKGDPTVVQKAMNLSWKIISRINGAPIRYIKRLIFSRPVMFVVKCPWKIITALPMFSLIKLPVENFFSQLIPKRKSNDDKKSDGSEEQPPLVEEIDIPSVTELVRAGVKFVPTSKDLTTIRFDAKTVTLYLPIINLDDNTEVVLRNLVAYEASVVTGPMVFTRYAELMYGVIDTEEDVKTLRENGILVNRMKSDGEAAEMWNGMSKSVRLSKVAFLDKTIGDVNRYYGSRWGVKCRMLMKKYVYASWPILTFLAAGLLIFLNCVQAFCSVYSCSSHLTQLINSGDGA